MQLFLIYGSPVGKGKVAVGRGGRVAIGTAGAAVGRGDRVAIGTAGAAVGTGKVGKPDDISVEVGVDNRGDVVGTSVMGSKVGVCVNGGGFGVDRVDVGGIEIEVVVPVGSPGINVDVAFGVAVAKLVGSNVVAVSDGTIEAVGEGVSIVSKGVPIKDALLLSRCISVKIFKWIGGIRVGIGSAL